MGLVHDLFDPKSRLRKKGQRWKRHVRYWLQTKSSADRVLPNFVALGGMRCGTTAFFLYLKEHPNILPTVKKEPRFFDNFMGNYKRGEQWYRANFPTASQMEDHARSVTGPVLTGEATPYYLFHPKAPERLQAVVPEARLVVLLRNPVDRAYAHYFKNTRKGYESASFAERVEQLTALSFEEAHAMSLYGLEHGQEAWLAAHGKRYPGVEHPHDLAYLCWGHYAWYLEHWLEVFPREQFLIINSNAMFRDVAGTMQQAHDFLGIPHVQLPEYVNRPSKYPKMGDTERSRLQAYYAPLNQELEALLGESMGWDT